jgi:hypothetical protein
VAVEAFFGLPAAADFFRAAALGAGFDLRRFAAPADPLAARPGPRREAGRRPAAGFRAGLPRPPAARLDGLGPFRLAIPGFLSPA